MREIKFRGQDIDGNWVYGSLLRYSDSISYIASDIIEKPMELVSTETVGQYTGLLDKNQKEIYEGDIVNEFRVSRSFPEGRNIQHTIKWDEDMVLDDSYGMQAIGFCMYGGTLEVIGNIYENSGLIK